MELFEVVILTKIKTYKNKEILKSNFRMLQEPLEKKISYGGSYSHSETQQKRTISFIPFEGDDYRPTMHHGLRICEIRQMERGIHELLKRLKTIGVETSPQTEICRRRTKDQNQFQYRVRMQDVEEEVHRGYGQDNGISHLDEYLHLIGRMHAAGIIVSRYETRKAVKEAEECIAATQIPAVLNNKVIMYDWTKLTIADTREVKPPYQRHLGEWAVNLHFDLANSNGFGGVIGVFEKTEETQRRARIYLEGFKSVATPMEYARHADQLPRTLFNAFQR